MWEEKNSNLWQLFCKMRNETLQGVLGSGEKGVQNYREQGAWDQKDQGAGSKGK